MIGIKNTAYLKAFGRHLRSIRESKKISQENLALDAGLSLSQIGRIERGEINPTICTVLVLAQTLKIEPKILLEFEFNM
ncbi:helix-turn-helix transcriptional regulator [Rhodocytophaga rosea]|uniref:Helix-turn-helix transcriptional regulator n=1 Tax=Rhodocytophaga rosea TaxID=2704465 RepID=A0A6C0GI95_9BACT|nr:helix-turn-helix transcriptional regulator [Rhodocytophaga rosea]QHT67402.1 helix-turn-helix transcriptional regulator [Rhodocytophaga rosea]